MLKNKLRITLIHSIFPGEVYFVLNLIIESRLTRKIGITLSFYNREHLMQEFPYTSDREAEKPNKGQRGSTEKSNSKKPLWQHRMEDLEGGKTPGAEQPGMPGGRGTIATSDLGSAKERTQRRDERIFQLLSSYTLKSYKCLPLTESVAMGARQMQPAGVSPSAIQNRVGRVRRG